MPRTVTVICCAIEDETGYKAAYLCGVTLGLLFKNVAGSLNSGGTLLISHF